MREIEAGPAFSLQVSYLLAEEFRESEGIHEDGGVHEGEGIHEGEGMRERAGLQDAHSAASGSTEGATLHGPRTVLSTLERRMALRLSLIHI